MNYRVQYVIYFRKKLVQRISWALLGLKSALSFCEHEFCEYFHYSTKPTELDLDIPRPQFNSKLNSELWSPDLAYPLQKHSNYGDIFAPEQIFSPYRLDRLLLTVSRLIIAKRNRWYRASVKAYGDCVTRRIEFVLEKYRSFTKRTNDSITSVRELLYRVSVILGFSSGILWISICMYVIFYYLYMPDVTHIRPVHLQFISCNVNMGLCSFPSAHVKLTRRRRLLMSSQLYRIKLVMEVPETKMNKDLGMFLVCAQMRSSADVLVSSSCRSAMLSHRSSLHHVMRTLVYAPLLISDIHREIQMIEVELFSDFEDDQTRPVTDAYVELQSRFVQVLSCELHIEAHFTGLRYTMYYWPKISALIGICLNFFLVSLMIILIWYQLQDGLPDYIKIKFGIDIKDEKTEDDNKSGEKVKLKIEDSIPSIKEESFLEEFQILEKKEE